MFVVPPTVLYQIRYCLQDNFVVFASGIEECGKSFVYYKNKIIKIKSPSFLSVEKYIYSKKYSDGISTVSVVSFVCTITSREKIEENFILGKKYFEKKWKNHIRMFDERVNFRSCSFTKQVFVIGGTDRNVCVKYDLSTEP